MSRSLAFLGTFRALYRAAQILRLMVSNGQDFLNLAKCQLEILKREVGYINILRNENGLLYIIRNLILNAQWY